MFICLLCFGWDGVGLDGSGGGRGCCCCCSVGLHTWLGWECLFLFLCFYGVGKVRKSDNGVVLGPAFLGGVDVVMVMVMMMLCGVFVSFVP